MSKDKKIKQQKRRKWLDILRWVLIVVLLVVGLALISISLFETQLLLGIPISIK